MSVILNQSPKLFQFGGGQIFFFCNKGACGFYEECRHDGSCTLDITQQDVSRDAQTADQSTNHFKAQASAP